VVERPKNVHIKICGITCTADAINAVESGADAIGLVFYEQSPRAVSVSQARDIVQAVGPFVPVVGLFVNASKKEIEDVLQQVSLSILQFHGDETSSFCKQFHRPWIKALRMKPGVDMANAAQDYADASAILLDAYKEGVPGGTGETYAWNKTPANIKIPVIVAGGLNATNVTSAIKMVNPYAVDVSGGVESSPGKKDLQKMKAFVRAVRQLT
jgi:phosphoribosylanthranilate isomerase